MSSRRSYTAATATGIFATIPGAPRFPRHSQSGLRIRDGKRARAINHDHVFCAFNANGVRHAGWNYDRRRCYRCDDCRRPQRNASLAAADPARKSIQNYLEATLNKKHHVPLLVVIAPQLNNYPAHRYTSGATNLLRSLFSGMMGGCT